MKAIKITTITLLLIISVNALLNGYSFITDSSGGEVHISILMEDSSLNYYFFPAA
jgi:hypothetical protein